MSRPTFEGSTTQSGPKLRSSCDFCATSKIKCDRGNPQCGRCATLKLACVYGLSKKFGKPSRKRVASDTTSGVQKRPRVSQSMVHDQTDMSCLLSAKPLQHNTSRIGFPPFYPGGNLEWSGIVEDQRHLNSDFYPSIPFEEWPQMENLAEIGEWQQTGDWQFEASDTNLDVPPSNLLQETSISKIVEESHSCARDSYEIFRDLICPSPTLHAPESNCSTVSAQLDQVLQFNRKAIKRLTHVLKCPCAKSGHRAMVHASIVSRLLIWYQQAAGWTGSSSWGARPPVLVDSSSSESSLSSSQSPPEEASADPLSLVQATGFTVEHAPVTVGDFSIEDLNVQGAFRNQLVLSELKKTANLIEIFISICPDSNELSAGSLTGLYQHLGIWLQGEYSKTVNILKSRLKVLNGNSGS